MQSSEMRPSDAAAEALDFEFATDLLQQYLADPSQFPDPYPVFEAVRQREPVYWCDAGVWLVLGYQEAREVLANQRFSRRRAAEAVFGDIVTATSDQSEALATYLSWFIHLDDPEHFRLRSLVSRAFGIRALTRWDQAIVTVVDEAVASLAGRDQFDLLHDFAKVIPARVMCDMVGVPREDYDHFERWAAALVNINITDPRADHSGSWVEGLSEFVEYLRGVVQQRRREPLERDDLVQLLMRAEESGDRLSERELIASLMLLINAGHETTGNLIGNGCYALLRHPDQLDALRADRDLADAAVDEALRYDNPARSTPRMALEDLTAGERTIRAGDRIQVHVGAVNRDPRVFAAPHRFDLARDNRATHVGFGHGAHFCLGHHLARMEATRAFAAFAQDLGVVELAGEVAWRNSHVRGITALPVRRVA